LILCVSFINFTKQSAKVVDLYSNDLIADFTGPSKMITASTSEKKERLPSKVEISVFNFCGVSFNTYIIKKSYQAKYIM
jgi:hypothetical protein